jgi:hypothetical protein
MQALDQAALWIPRRRRNLRSTPMPDRQRFLERFRFKAPHLGSWHLAQRQQRIRERLLKQRGKGTRVNQTQHPLRKGLGLCAARRIVGHIALEDFAKQPQPFGGAD